MCCFEPSETWPLTVATFQFSRPCWPSFQKRTSARPVEARRRAEINLSRSPGERRTERLGQAVASERETYTQQTSAQEEECGRFRSRRMTTGAAGIQVEVGTVDCAIANREFDARLPDA